MIADFDFYISKFHGDKFKTNAKEFFKNENRAEYLLKKYGIDTAEETDDLKMCCCALAEAYSVQEETEAVNIKGIASESVAGYSVSYGSGSNSTYKSAFKSAVRDIIALYLGRDALYRGRGRHVL